MTWVQPRVLDYTQVKRGLFLVSFVFLFWSHSHSYSQSQVHSLRDRVAEWSTQIRDTIKLIEDTAPEVAAHS